MYKSFSYKDQRQARYRERARRARFWGRLLMPVCALSMSAAVWSEPALAERLREGLAVIRPLISGETRIQLALADDAAAAPYQGEATTDAPLGASLPTSKTQVNRP